MSGPPMTPVNQTSAVMREAALFKDSPAYDGSSPSIFELIEERKHQTGWWLKRMSSTCHLSYSIAISSFPFFPVIDQGATISSDVAQRAQELEEYTAALDKGIADLPTLRKLILLCHRNPYHAPTSPPASPFPREAGNGTPMSPTSPSPHAMYLGKSGFPVMLGDIWDGGSRSEKLFNALCTFLQPDKVSSIFWK